MKSRTGRSWNLNPVTRRLDRISNLLFPRITSRIWYTPNNWKVFITLSKWLILWNLISKSSRPLMCCIRHRFRISPRSRVQCLLSLKFVLSSESVILFLNTSGSRSLIICLLKECESLENYAFIWWSQCMINAKDIYCSYHVETVMTELWTMLLDIIITLSSLTLRAQNLESTSKIFQMKHYISNFIQCVRI